MSTKQNKDINVFDDIAESWYRLRHWSRFKTELENLAKVWHTGRLLNIGCAHGPDFLPFKGDFELWGLDSSWEMVRMATKYAEKFKFSPNLVVADAVNLPFKDQSFDYAIAVAVYHHIKGRESRLKAFKELRRILRPRGEVFITVWNWWQSRFWYRGKEVLVPWRTKNHNLYRYHYLFTYFEIEALLKNVGFTVVRSLPEKGYGLPLKLFSRNICILARSA